MLGPHPPGPEPLGAVTGTRPEQAEIWAASPGPRPVSPVPGALPARWHEAPRTQRPEHNVDLGLWGPRGLETRPRPPSRAPHPHTPSPCAVQSINTRVPGCPGRQWGTHGEQGRHALQPSPGFPGVTAGPSLVCQGQGSPEQGSMAAPQGQQCLEARGGRPEGQWGVESGWPWQDMVARGCCAAEGKLLPSEGCRLHAGLVGFKGTKPWDPHPDLSPPQPGAPQLKPRSGPPEMFCLALLTPALASLPSPCLACPGASRTPGLPEAAPPA